MAKLLYLVHRLPYPPNKGDKVRSYHLLKHLAARHEVHLGTFVDDPDDLQYLDTVRALCAGVHAVSLSPRRAKVASLLGLATGQALTLRYYRDAGMHRWVDETLARGDIDAAVVFSSSMAPYVDRRSGVPMLVDLVDVDSAKWSAYAENHPWPLSWLYRREGARLLAYERAVVSRAAASYLVTDKEVALFEGLAPEARGRVQAMGNGVDADYFAPDVTRASPFAEGELPLVFTGAMDYWPNVDAVTWFAREILPVLRRSWPGLRLHIVGRAPTPAVLALAGEAVAVTGTVPDVRPYLQHAAVVVAPLRLARGVQNKILEAMAMARPVVAAAGCVDALGAADGNSLLAAVDAAAYQAQIHHLLGHPGLGERIGQAARRCVVDHYHWPACLARLDHSLAALARPSLHGPVP